MMSKNKNESDKKDSKLLIVDDMPMKKIKPNPKYKLTSQQAMFVNEYIKHGHPEHAVLAAGYNPKNPLEQAKLLLSTPKVQRALKTLQVQLSPSDIVTFEDKLRVLRDHLFCSDREVSIRAASELNKMQGHYAPTKNINLNMDLTIEAFDQLGINIEKY